MHRFKRRFVISAGLFLTLLAAAGGTPYAQSNPVPLINQPLVPDAVAPGGQSFTLTVNGTGFVPGSVVQWNGRALATTYVSGSQLTATVPSSDIVTVGTGSVTVSNGTPETTSAPALFPVTQSTAGVGFGQQSFAVGSTPGGAVAADLNGDGKLDVVVANYPISAISVLLGNGNGTFQPEVEYPAGNSPVLVEVGDFNGDGIPDLAVGNAFASSGDGISILLGNGDGSFQLPLFISVATDEYALAAADFNGDGRLDLAVTSYPNQVWILLGNGDGTFQSPNYFAAGSLQPEGIAVGDFNGDGTLDLAVAASDAGAVAILLGNGDGTFQNYVEYLCTNEVFQVVAADLNGDGKLDLALAANNGVDVLLGNGDGTFQDVVLYSVLPEYTNFVVAGDFNGDGKLDLASGGLGPPLYVLLGAGDGTFQTFGSFPIPGGSTQYGVDALLAGDFNGDGRIDLATDSYSFNTVTAFLQVTSVVSPTTVNFGRVKVRTKTAPVPITLTNTGQTPFTVTAVELSGGEKAYFSESNDCLHGSVPPSGSCTIKVAFRPRNTGLFAATLTVKDTADNSPQFVNVGGTGVQ